MIYSVRLKTVRDLVKNQSYVFSLVLRDLTFDQISHCGQLSWLDYQTTSLCKWNELLNAKIEIFLNLLILLRKTSFFLWKMNHFLLLKICLLVLQFFIIFIDGHFHHFLLIKWMLQPLTTHDINTILEIKMSLWSCTPCIRGHP